MASGDTNVTICSDALVMLGESPISSFTGDVGSACSAMYEDVKRSTLQMYPWSFSINRYDPVATRTDAVQETGTAQAGASSTITLKAATRFTSDDEPNLMYIRITSGTGSGQIRRISDYVASTKVATVYNAWDTAPDSTSAYEIKAFNLWRYRYTHPSEDANLSPSAFEGVRAIYNSRNIGGSVITDDWEYRGNYVYSNQPIILIEYQENTAEANLPSYFVQLLKYQMAWHLAETVTDQITKAEYWRTIALGSPVENMRGGYFRSATSIDGGSKQIQSIDDHILIGVRG